MSRTEKSETLKQLEVELTTTLKLLTKNKDNIHLKNQFDSLVTLIKHWEILVKNST